MNMNKKGQVFVEFIFSMMITIILLYGLVMIFKWVGRDYAMRRISHDKKLMTGNNPQEQINPYFYNPEEMRSVYTSE